jgi:hypothetical protein
LRWLSYLNTRWGREGGGVDVRESRCDAECSVAGRLLGWGLNVYASQDILQMTFVHEM